MDTKTIIEYLQQRKKGATIPELQTTFSLSYSELREALFGLESEGKIELRDNLHYVLCPEKIEKAKQLSRAKQLESLRREIEKESLEFKQILRSCAIDGSVKTERLLRNHDITRLRLRIMLSRMHELGVLDEEENCKINLKEYTAMFGYESENSVFRGYWHPNPRSVSAERHNMAIARTRFGPLVKQMPFELPEEDGFFDDIVSWPTSVKPEEVPEKISDGERKAIGVLDLFAALLEFEKPPKDRNEAIRDVRLCLHMLRNLPPSFLDAVERLDEAHKNLMTSAYTEFEDIRAAYFSDHKD